MSSISQLPNKTTGYVHASTGISTFADARVTEAVKRTDHTRSKVLRQAVQFWAESQSAKKSK